MPAFIDKSQSYFGIAVNDVDAPLNKEQDQENNRDKAALSLLPFAQAIGELIGLGNLQRAEGLCLSMTESLGAARRGVKAARRGADVAGILKAMADEGRDKNE